MKRMFNKIRKRKYIGTVLLSMAMIVLFVIGGAIYVAHATNKDIVTIENTVTIGEAAYTRDNPLNIIELVPDESVGVWGYLTGMNNGAVKWADIASLPDSPDKQDLCNIWLTNYMKSIISYGNYGIPDKKENAQYGGKFIYYRDNASSDWKLYAKDCASEITSSTEFKFNILRNNGESTEIGIYDKTFVDEDGNVIEGYNDNLLAYMIFSGNDSIVKGDYNMMDKIRVTSVAIDKLTTEMIDNTDAIIVSAGEDISTYPAETYKKMYEYAQKYGDNSLKEKYPAKPGITDVDWSNHTWGDNACLGKDFNSSVVAGKIYYRYINQEIGIIGGVNYNKINTETQKNLMKLFIGITGIDRDTCFRDLCEEQVFSDDMSAEITGVFEGEYGRFDFDNMEMYIFNSDRSSLRKISYSDWIDMSQGVYGKYLGEWPNVSNYYSQFPYKAYNVAPDRINENVFWYGYGNNPLRTGFISSDINISYTKNEFNQVDDVLGLYENNNGNIAIAKMIQYVLGGYKKNRAIEKLTVLEIQPSADYVYNTYENAKSLIKYIKGAKFKINISGISERNYKRYIDVTSVSVSELNGMTENIANNYDLVIIGDNHSNGLLKVKGRISQNDETVAESYYYSQGTVMNLYGRDSEDSNKIKDTDKDSASAGNDITEKTYEKIREYIDMDKPIIMSSSIYNAANTYVKMQDASGNYNTRQVDTRIYSILPYAKNNGKKGNVTVEVTGNSVDDSAKISYRFKPIIRQTIPDAGLNTEDNTFSVKIKTDNVKGQYNVELYIDKDANGVFVNAHDDTGELYAGGFNAVNPVIYTHENGYITIKTTTLPNDIRPYLPWKIVIKDVSTGLTAETTGVLRVNISDDKTEDVKVLQIMPDLKNNNDSYTLKLNDNDFMNLFNAVSNETGLKISKKDVDIVTVKELCEGVNGGKSWYKSSTYEAGTSLNTEKDLLKDYTIVVLGFADRFDNITNTHALANLRDYIESGKAVLMTHDTIGQYSYTDKGTRKTEYLFAGDDSDVRYGVPMLFSKRDSNGFMFATAFRELVGMDMYHVTVGNGTEGLDYQQGYSNSIFARYGVLPGKKYTDTSNFLYADGYNKGEDRSISPFLTNKVNKLNDGQITSYPYEIPDDLDVANTHGQYYLLDLEKQDAAADSIDSGDDVVVWYTLGQNSNDSNKYFSATGRDAANNYYIYSKGNITYSGAGHSDINGEDELKLFVNTIIWAINSGNNAPTIKVENAIKMDDGVYEMYSLDGTIPDIQFVASDIDMGSDTSALMSSGVFYWDKNEDSKYTKNSADDVVIQEFDKNVNGYNVYNGVSEKLISARFANGSVTRAAGLEYTSALSSLVRKDFSSGGSEVYKQMMNQLSTNGYVYMGLQVSDSKGGTGKAVIRVVKRDLFRLD